MKAASEVVSEALFSGVFQAGPPSPHQAEPGGSAWAPTPRLAPVGGAQASGGNPGCSRSRRLSPEQALAESKGRGSRSGRGGGRGPGGGGGGGEREGRGSGRERGRGRAPALRNG